MTPEEEDRQIAALKALKHACRTLEAGEIERLILNADQLAVPIHEHLKHTARTPALIELLREHPDPLVRGVVCRVFHDTRPRSARQALLEALFDPEPWVRLEAADAYMKVARREDAPIVLAALELGERCGVTVFLVQALGDVRADRAAPALVELLDDRSLAIYAKWALGRLSPEAVRSAFARAIASAAPPEEAARLRRVLEELQSAQDASGQRIIRTLVNESGLGRQGRHPSLGAFLVLPTRAPLLPIAPITVWPDTSGQPSGTSVAFAYLGDGSRLEKSVDGGAPTASLWDRAGGLPRLLDDGTTSAVHVAGVLTEIDDATGDRAWGRCTTRWAGEQADAETGLTQLPARSYSPVYGRFLAHDDKPSFEVAAPRACGMQCN